MTASVLGIAGGSGVYDIEMDNARWEKIDSAWGQPSDQIRTKSDLANSGLKSLQLPLRS